MATVLKASSNRTLDALLELVCIQIQLTDTQDRRARAHYAAVADWLAREGSPLYEFSPHIYPQGSQRIGTTTRPLGQSEFDLDAVCKLAIQDDCHPGELYQLIWARLYEHETYRPMMRRMPRCIRLEYSGDFHLDIAPAIPDTECGGSCILVPDLDANLALLHPENDRWKSSNPIGHGDWVEDQCVPVLIFNEGQLKASQVDPVPDREAIHAKPALKRSIQLYKRWRDVEYSDRPKLATPSIILTTMSGHYYERQQLCTDSLHSILDTTVSEIESGRRLRFSNPAHPDENICEKWDNSPAAYRDFTTAVTAFRDRWVRLQSMRGLPQIEEELSDLFGESPVRAAIRAMADKHIIQPRTTKSLHVRPETGLLVPATTTGRSVQVRSNNFHGDAQ
jgi:hypothetical protein